MNAKAIFKTFSPDSLTVNDTLLKNKITYYHIVFFLIMLPFDLFYSEIVLVSLMCHCLFHFHKQKIRSFFTIENLVLSSVFLLNIIAISWANDKNQALRETTRQTAIILFPFIFSVIELNLKHYRQKLLMIFSITCLVAVIYLYADAIRIILYNKLSFSTLFSPVFMNHNFSEPIKIHATYLSIYVAMSVSVFLYFLFLSTSNLIRCLYAIAIAILILGLFQLASKSVMISTILLIAIGFPLFMAKKENRIRIIFITLGIAGIVFIGITRIDSYRKEFVVELKNDLTQNSVNNEIIEPRIIRWKSAVTLIKKAPLIGYGSGSEISVLKDQYFKDKLYNSYLNELNTHNQYLSFLINTGIIGLFFFLITLFIGFMIAYQKRDIIFLGFMIIISVVAFSENILSLNKGIFFYAFFFSLFLKTNKLSLKLHSGGKGPKSLVLS